MADEDLVKIEQLKIQSLSEQIKNLTQPQKTISHQISCMKYGNRNQVQKRLINRRKKLKLNTQIAESNNIISSLNTSIILGV